MQDLSINGVSSVIPLFTVPVGVYTDTNYDDIKDELVSMCYSEKELDASGRVVSNRGGWQSGGNWFLEERNKFFNKYLHKMVEKLFYECFDHSGELSFSLECWININPPSALNSSHTHPACDYTGVFYIHVPNNPPSPIVFDSPHSHCYGLTYSMYSENFKKSYGLYSEIEVYPSDGTLLIFPSDLRHFVDPNGSDEDRISIAFNIDITEYGRFAENKFRGKIKC